jgi:hypothetical protein
VDLTAYAFRPGDDEAKLTILKLESAGSPEGLTAALSVDYWFNGDFANTLSATQPSTYIALEQMFDKRLSSRKSFQFVSPDHSLFIPTDAPIVQDEPGLGTKSPGRSSSTHLPASFSTPSMSRAAAPYSLRRQGWAHVLYAYRPFAVFRSHNPPQALNSGAASREERERGEQTILLKFNEQPYDLQEIRFHMDELSISG